MKKKSAAAVIAALIVVALGFFASFFLSFTDGKDENYTITLPGQGSAVIDTNPVTSCKPCRWTEATSRP